jgi:membrane fusion protein, multidrug efflux system
MRSYLCVVPAVLLLGGCGKEAVTRAAGTTPSAVPVQTSAVALQQWPAIYEATGTVRARTTATLSSKVTGYVQQVSVQVGERVRAGQVLVTLDARDLEVSVRRAEAARAEVESAVPELESATAAAKANLDLAQATFRRMEELAAKKSISNQEFDEASARLKAAQANYEMARARRMQLNSKMVQVEQEVRAAGILRDYAKVSAPFAGVVIARTAEPGNLAAPGAPLLTLEQDGLYRLEASVEESKQAGIRIGQTVEAMLQGVDRAVSARVSEIVPAVDPGSRTYVVKLDLPAIPQLRTGMFGRALFAAGAQTVAAIPTAALVERGQLQAVFVVEDGTAHSRLVTTGRRAAGQAEILSGLNEGERVVSPVPPGLQDGARVEVRQ